MTERVVFLDRDGVINKEPEGAPYIRNWGEFKFQKGAIEAVKLLKDEGFRIFVLSNQAGIARGLVTKENLADITRHMLKIFSENGAVIDGVFYCEHDDADGCDCRKPKDGLFRKALGKSSPADIRAANVGDSERDLEAAKGLGCRNVLVLSGKVRKGDVAGFKTKPDAVCRDLAEAAEWIVREFSK